MIKYKYIVLFIGCFIFLSAIKVNAQYADCTPNPDVNDVDGAGIRVPVDMPVAFLNEEYNSSLTIIPPSKADTWGIFNITITKIQIVEIVDMPSGLSWESNSNNVDDYLYAAERYCVVVNGTPNELPGIRKMDVLANAWVRTLFEYQALGNPQNGGDITFTICNELDLNLGANRTITTDEEITLCANQYTSFHTYLWNNNSTNVNLHISGDELGVGTHHISVAVYDTVGTTGIYVGRESRCVKSDEIIITVVEGNYVPAEKINQFVISPNPSNGIITVTNYEIKKNTPIEVRDTKGTIVYSSNLTDNVSEINLSHLKKGIYLLYSPLQKNSSPMKIVLY